MPFRMVGTKHNLNQPWPIVNWTLENKDQWIVNQVDTIPPR